MSEEQRHTTHDHGPDGYEKRDVNVGKVLVYGVAGTIVLIVLLVFMLDFFTASREQIMYEMVLKPESAILKELHEREQKELGSYGVVDTLKGLYRIPIDTAMKKVVEEQDAGMK